MANSDDRNACESGSGEEAIAACGRLLALDPNDAVTYYHRGRAYHVKNDYDQAIADYDPARSELCSCLLQPRRRLRQQGRFRPGGRRLDQAIRLDPHNAAA
jgi:tetratricopeptide (TPR) repeat protein